MNVPAPGTAIADRFRIMRIEANEQVMEAQRAAHGRRVEIEPRVVTAERTPVSREQIRASLARAWERTRGAPAPERALDMLTAHASLETGRGSRMYNFNFGGIKGTSPAGLTAGAMTHEVIDGQRTQVRAFFRAYRTLDEGAEDYLGLLERRYGTALDAAAAGDPDRFAHALKSRGYFTGDETDYANTLRGLLGMPPGQRPAAGPMPDELDPSRFSTSVELARVLDAVSRSAARIAAPEDAEI
jgi:flagellar protein FlgJ